MGRPKKTTESHRQSISFDFGDLRQKLVFEYLKDLPNGARGKAITDAICMRAEVIGNNQFENEIKRAVSESVNAAIDQAIPRVIDGVIEQIKSQNIDLITNEEPQNDSSSQTESSAMAALSLVDMFG